jgi:hypothetical protein
MRGSSQQRRLFACEVLLANAPFLLIPRTKNPDPDPNSSFSNWKEGRGLTISPKVVRLNVHALDLAIQGRNRVALASVGAQERRSRELDVQGAGEGAVMVAQEADAALLVGIEGLAPRVHAVAG